MRIHDNDWYTYWYGYMMAAERYGFIRYHKRLALMNQVDMYWVAT